MPKKLSWKATIRGLAKDLKSGNITIGEALIKPTDVHIPALREYCDVIASEYKGCKFEITLVKEQDDIGPCLVVVAYNKPAVLWTWTILRLAEMPDKFKIIVRGLIQAADPKRVNKVLKGVRHKGPKYNKVVVRIS